MIQSLQLSPFRMSDLRQGRVRNALRLPQLLAMQGVLPARGAQLRHDAVLPGDAVREDGLHRADVPLVPLQEVPRHGHGPERYALRESDAQGAWK